MSAKLIKPRSTTIVKPSQSKAKAPKNNNETVTCVLSKRSMSTNTDIPSPIDFDIFLPWVCLHYQILVEVTVKKAVAEKYVSRRKSSVRTRSTERKAFQTDGLKSSERKAVSQQIEPILKKANLLPPEKQASYTPPPTDKIPVIAYYDVSGFLVEIAIIKSPIKILQNVVKCINMCLPYHTSLIKFSITHGSLSAEVVYEIAKTLPLSFITDVCLDGCYIKEGNYYILLDNISPLKVLSLKRCRINDIVVKEIAKRIDMFQPASGLTVLDLGSNLITDKGVWYLGDVLRRNRNLLHLCLSDNRITETGVDYIMNPLKEFEMSQEEIYGMRKRQLEFLQRIRISKQEKEDHIKPETSDQGTQVNFRGKGSRKKLLKKRKQSTQDLVKENGVLVSVIEQEEFTDVFDDHHVVIRDGIMYCTGNFTLCSLNLAYNKLDFLSVKKIFDAVLYQSQAEKAPPLTGLLRISLAGNLIPDNCDELREIALLLSSAVSSGSLLNRVLKSRSKF